MVPSHNLDQRSDAMAQILVYTAGCGGATPYAAAALRKAGIPLVDHPTPDATHLLLDVPCREIPEGNSSIEKLDCITVMFRFSKLAACVISFTKRAETSLHNMQSFD